jgi:hypothetical protein
MSQVRSTLLYRTMSRSKIDIGARVS